MALDLAAWKITFAERLPQWQGRMQQEKVDSLYALLAAVALWPVAEAIHAGDLTGLVTLGSVLGAANRHMLASRLLHWQKEADAVQQLAAAVVAEPDLRAEVDAVLTALEALQQARHALPEAERPWFVESLQTELARLGNATHWAVHLTGSGAIAQGAGAVAAGAGGVAIGGDVQSSTIIGTVQVVKNVTPVLPHVTLPKRWLFTVASW